MASKWPEVRIQPTNPTEHALQLKNDAANLKAHITNQSKKPIIHHVAIKLLGSAESLMDKILNQPSLAEMMAEIKAVNICKMETIYLFSYHQIDIFDHLDGK